MKRKAGWHIHKVPVHTCIQLVSPQLHSFVFLLAFKDKRGKEESNIQNVEEYSKDRGEKQNRQKTWKKRGY